MGKLLINEYKDKVRACWLGKNVGGTLGGPFEGHRGVFEVTGYTHDLSKGALPNDDLDLQLCFLRAAKEWGRKVNASILAEYWMSQIVAHWDEYGMGKANLRFGLEPPVSGFYNNPYGESDGCFIRSEIWGCLAPGHPEIAVKYALEDAIVDHKDEGVYSEIFCAALQSAAFVISDREKLIEIASSYIPEDCAVRGAVELVKKCYSEGKTWRDTRVEVLTAYPSSFCHIYHECEPQDAVPNGKVGFNAPANIGLMMIGWYYGEGDFSKSLCITCSCGDDADCTCATLGAIFGIIYGTKVIDKKWIDAIGEDIKTVSLDLTANGTPDEIPQNITDLTEQVVKLMPTFVYDYVDYFGSEENQGINYDEVKMYDIPVRKHFGRPVELSFKADLKERLTVSVKVENAIFDAFIDYIGDIEISEGVEKELKVKVFNKFDRQYWGNLTVHAPAEWEVLPAKESSILVDVRLKSLLSEAKIKIVPHGLCKGKYSFPIELHIDGRPTSIYLPVTLVVR